MKEKNPVFKNRNGNCFTFHTGRMIVNDVERSGFSTSATLLYLRMLLFPFQNKQPLILARGVFDKEALGIIHHSLGKQSPCLCIYSFYKLREKSLFKTCQLKTGSLRESSGCSVKILNFLGQVLNFLSPKRKD